MMTMLPPLPATKLRRCRTTGSSPVEASASMLTVEEEKPRKNSSKKSKSRSKKSSRSPSQSKKKSTEAVFDLSLVVQQDSSQQLLEDALNNSWGSISIESVLTEQEDDDDASIRSVSCRSGRTLSSRRRGSISSRHSSRSRSPLTTTSMKDRSGRSTHSSASGSGKSIGCASLLGDDLFHHDSSDDEDEVNMDHSWVTAELKRRTTSTLSSPKSVKSLDKNGLDKSWGELQVEDYLTSSIQSQKSSTKRKTSRTKSSSSAKSTTAPRLPQNPARIPTQRSARRTVSMGSTRQQQSMSSSSRTGIRTRIPRVSSTSSSPLLLDRSRTGVRPQRRNRSKPTTDDASGRTKDKP